MSLCLLFIVALRPSKKKKLEAVEKTIQIWLAADDENLKSMPQRRRGERTLADELAELATAAPEQGMRRSTVSGWL